MNLLHIRQLRKHGLVTQWYKYYAVVNESAQGDLNRLFLTTSLSPHRDENRSIFAGKSTGNPESTGRIPERLPLSRKVSESSGDAEEKRVIGGENLWRDYWESGLAVTCIFCNTSWERVSGTLRVRRSNRVEREEDGDAYW